MTPFAIAFLVIYVGLSVLCIAWWRLVRKSQAQTEQAIGLIQEAQAEAAQWRRRATSAEALLAEYQFYRRLDSGPEMRMS